MTTKVDNNTVLVIFKEGAAPAQTMSALTAITTNIKFDRLINIKDEVEKFKATNAVSSLAHASDDQIFGELYKNMSEEEKKIYRIYQIKTKSEEESKSLIDSLSKDPNVESVQFNHLNKLYNTQPNDPLYPQLYGLKKMDCARAWDRSQGEQIIVAVLDTGIDYNHPDIKDNIWQDSNGKYGYDFSDNNDDPNDNQGHGTHVAGTIAAVTNNQRGVAGVAPKAKVMAVKIFPNAYDDVIVKAIKWAVDHGAKVLNNSWGPQSHNPSNPALEMAIDYAYERGAIAVFAAGNEDDDVKFYSPANYDKTISVAATNANDQRPDYSNFGELVDVAAPGDKILSLKFNSSDYETKSGTSMACPHVAGLVALIVSQQPSLNYEQVRDILKNSADRISTDKPVGAGRVNAASALSNSANIEKDERKEQLVMAGR